MTLHLRPRFLFLLVMCFIVVSCAGGGNRIAYHEKRRLLEHQGVKSLDNSHVQDGPYRRWHANGLLAQETIFAQGKKNGRHSLWYENGNRKLIGWYADDHLDGAFQVWYENGKSRLDIRFDKGKRTGDWIRTGEKVGVVARVSFKNDHLDGPLMVSVNRGYGNGSGRSLEFMAYFQAGRLISSFDYREADPKGNQMQLTGTIQPDGLVQVQGKKNIIFHPDGRLTSLNVRSETTYNDIGHFFATQIKNRIMPMFTLDFCGIEIGTTPVDSLLTGHGSILDVPN